MSFIPPWQSTTCPFCFRSFHISETGMRLTSFDAPKTKDEKLGKFLSIPSPDMPTVTAGTSKSFISRLLYNVTLSNGHDSKRVCPRCHMFLPYAAATGQLGSEVVAIVGARSSGKSNLFGVLLDSLERRYADEVGFTIYDQETFSVTEMRPVSSKRLYRDRYGNRLFGASHRMAIDQSRSARQDRNLRIPLIYRMEFPRKLIHCFTRPFSPVNALDLVVFDAAGEDLEDAETLDQFCRYITRASGIIFVIDPFQFDGLRSRMSSALRERYPKIEVGPTEIVSRVIHLFETRGGVRVGRKISVPVAFAFSKSDGLMDLVHPSSSILRDSRHEGGFDVGDVKLLGEEVSECIREWEGPGLLNLARRKFEHYSFFALSALGQLPDKDLNIAPVAPLRVADPLLWILWKHGYLSTL